MTTKSPLTMLASLLDALYFALEDRCDVDNDDVIAVLELYCRLRRSGALPDPETRVRTVMASLMLDRCGVMDLDDFLREVSWP